MSQITTVKVAMCGDPESGKTTLAQTFSSGRAAADIHTEPTIDDSYQCLFYAGNHAVRLDIADLSGLPEYAAFRAQQFSDVDIFILSFAINDAWSYESLPSWIEEIRTISSEAPFILVGCKSDLRSYRGKVDSGSIIKTSKAAKFAKEKGAKMYIECSALTGENVRTVMEDALKLILDGSPCPPLLGRPHKYTLPEDQSLWRDRLLESFKNRLYRIMPMRVQLWVMVRRSLSVYPLSLLYIIQSYNNESPVFSPSLLHSIEELFKHLDETSPQSLAGLLSAYKAAGFLLSETRQYLHSNLSRSSSKSNHNGQCLSSQSWLNLLDETQIFDLLDMEKSILPFAAKINENADIVSNLAPSIWPDLIDVLFEILQLGDRLQDKRKISRFLHRLVSRTGQLPKPMIISAVKRIDPNPITGGGFADVWRGLYGRENVALKVLRFFGQSESNKQILRLFCSEALVWHRLKHSNVLPFYGVCVLEFAPQYALVSPWMQNGHTLEFLEKNPFVDRVCLILGIAEGLAYLHDSDPTVVHGDLRASNVLIDDNGKPKISDFGLASVIDSQATTINKSSFAGQGSMRWQAPELLNSSRFRGIKSCLTTASDVYAFSCTCIEIFTEKVPFPDLRDGEVILEVAIRDGRPPRPTEPAASRGLSDDVWLVMQDCWDVQPGKRPAMTDVLRRFK